MARIMYILVTFVLHYHESVLCGRVNDGCCNILVIKKNAMHFGKLELPDVILIYVV